MAEWLSGQTVILLVFLTVALYIDVKTLKIPNTLNATGIMLGVAIHVLTDGWLAALHSIVGLTVGFTVAFPLYACKAVGAGDVKCFAALGAIGGWKFAIITLAYALLFGGCYALFRFLLTGFQRFPKRFSSWIWTTAVCRCVFPYNGGTFKRIPFMLAVWPAALWTIGGGTIAP